MDVQQFINYLRGNAKQNHHLLTPVNLQNLSQAEEHLGPIPPWLRELLAHMDGGDLFQDSGPFVTLFSLQSDLPRGELFPKEWSIKNYTQRWRSFGNRTGEWVFGITNYGGLLIAKLDGSVMEWDTQYAKILQQWPSYRDSFDWIVAEGIKTLG